MDIFQVLLVVISSRLRQRGDEFLKRWHFVEHFIFWESPPALRRKTNLTDFQTRFGEPRVLVAILEQVADAALEAAIESADLGLALAVIESSYAKRAFRFDKFLRKAAPGIAGLSLAPLAALSLASQLPGLTNIADPTHLIGLTCAGIVTYVGLLSILGFVAITARND
jgi:hypothetical protein